MKKMADEVFVFVLTKAHPAIAENTLIKTSDTAVIMMLDNSELG